jgi:DNA-binding MarR family transcriptional regulator
LWDDVKEACIQERNAIMMLEINEQEKEILISQLEVMVLPELRCQIGSRVPKDIRDDLKKDKMMLVSIVEKLKASR